MVTFATSQQEDTEIYECFKKLFRHADNDDGVEDGDGGVDGGDGGVDGGDGGGDGGGGGDDGDGGYKDECIVREVDGVVNVGRQKYNGREGVGVGDEEEEEEEGEEEEEEEEDGDVYAIKKSNDKHDVDAAYNMNGGRGESNRIVEEVRRLVEEEKEGWNKLQAYLTLSQDDGIDNNNGNIDNNNNNKNNNNNNNNNNNDNNDNNKDRNKTVDISANLNLDGTLLDRRADPTEWMERKDDRSKRKWIGGVDEDDLNVEVKRRGGIGVEGSRLAGVLRDLTGIEGGGEGVRRVFEAVSCQLEEEKRAAVLFEERLRSLLAEGEGV